MKIHTGFFRQTFLYSFRTNPQRLVDTRLVKINDIPKKEITQSTTAGAGLAGSFCSFSFIVLFFHCAHLAVSLLRGLGFCATALPTRNNADTTTKPKGREKRNLGLARKKRDKQSESTGHSRPTRKNPTTFFLSSFSFPFKEKKKREFGGRVRVRLDGDRGDCTLRVPRRLLARRRHTGRRPRRPSHTDWSPFVARVCVRVCLSCVCTATRPWRPALGASTCSAVVGADLPDTQRPNCTYLTTARQPPSWPSRRQRQRRQL